MNLADMANQIYSTYHSTNGAAYGTTPGMREKLDILSRDEFVASMLQEHQARWASGGAEEARDLYAGSATRATLSDTEIAVLANKYDVRNMDGETFDAFLDDLQSMGAISEREKGTLGYNGLVTCGHFDANGEFVAEGAFAWVTEGKNTTPFSHSARDSGDMVKWLSDRLQWKAIGLTDPSSPENTEASAKAAQQANEMYQSLAGIISRMTGTQLAAGEENGGTDEEPDLIDQIADPNSAFYQDMFQRMRLKLEQSEEDKKEQAIIDALGAILDGMRSTDGVTKKKDMATSMAGLSKQISELDEEDPRRAQLDLFRQRLNQLGIFVDLDLGVKGSKDKDKGWQTLTQRLISEENSTFDPSIFDLI